MTKRLAARAAALVLSAALIAACGSGPAASTASQRPGSTPGGGGAATPRATGAGAPAATATSPAASPAAATAPPAGGAGTGPCDWITEAEMTTILGGTIAAPDRARAKPGICDWSNANRTVFINIHEDEAGTIQALRIGDPRIEELSIGEGGVWSSVSRGAYLFKGGRVLAVQIIFVPASLSIRDVAVAIATAALARF